ncbi:hypothetical protein BV898_04487 [Hypsibius exemplaris]|uniref:Uncharacterized protein n=1 Tax=Hypsibius exemplaris TaxID=2072580 RepID=A0A1W0X292_HYPEX|nr:hypothetical protein BV898_04487 [Hypsibius exemplaris]
MWNLRIRAPVVATALLLTILMSSSTSWGLAVLEKPGESRDYRSLQFAELRIYDTYHARSPILKVPGLKVPGPKVPGLKVPGPKVPGPKVPGPKVPGPKVPGPQGPRSPRSPVLKVP